MMALPSSSLLGFLFAAAAAACAARAQNATWGTEDSAIMEQLRASVKWLPGVQPDPVNASSGPCNWTSDLVTCDEEGRVYTITLGNIDISGGTVPPTNQNDLPNLGYFDVPHCNLEGVIPNFTGSPQLHSLVVGENGFSSIAPGLFDSKTELQFVEMDDNDRLEPWQLPEGLKSSSKLSSFSAAGCNIQGPLPPFFNVSLVGLYLSNNNLSGDISALQNLTGLQQIELQHNQLSGKIPDLSSLKWLEYLYLNNNNLTGPIPESLTTLPYLVKLDLSNNQLAGPLPAFPSGVTVVICGNPGFDPC